MDPADSAALLRDGCPDCDVIRACRGDGHALFVAELPAAFVLLHGERGPHGRVRLVAKAHVADLIEVEDATREAFWKDLDLVVRALRAAFGRRRLNVWSEATAGLEGHAAWDLVPRDPKDGDADCPAWSLGSPPPDPDQAAELRRRILRGLLTVAPVRRQAPSPVRRRH